MTSAERFEAYRLSVEAELARIMDACQSPSPLKEAMRYSLLAGGKRLRPVLLLAACEMGGGSVVEAMPYACAIEMIHTYSLIHDDLPAMDDDDLRRGRPTNHKVFGEGMAVLAGDGLYSLAFETMLDAAETPAHIGAMRRIARGAGVVGMAAGQCMDLSLSQSEGGGAEEIAYIHLHKTADMFIGAVTAGLTLAGVDESRVRAGEQYAKALGLAFQIQDDLLDIRGDAMALGKKTGMDAAHGKLTWPSVFGAAAAEAEVCKQTSAAVAALSPFGDEASFLAALVERLLSRDR